MQVAVHLLGGDQHARAVYLRDLCVQNLSVRGKNLFRFRGHLAAQLLCQRNTGIMQVDVLPSTVTVRHHPFCLFDRGLISRCTDQEYDCRSGILLFQFRAGESSQIWRNAFAICRAGSIQHAALYVQMQDQPLDSLFICEFQYGHRVIGRSCSAASDPPTGFQFHIPVAVQGALPLMEGDYRCVCVIHGLPRCGSYCVSHQPAKDLPMLPVSVCPQGHIRHDMRRGEGVGHRDPDPIPFCSRYFHDHIF